MDVSNTTGSDTDYKVTTSGGTRLPPKGLPKGWTKLPKHSRVQHEVGEVDRCRVEFKVTDKSGDQIVGGWCDDPHAHVQLVERGGKYEVDVNVNGH